MLLQFNFKNFKSFRDDTTLDMTATKITEFSNHVISSGNENVLPVAAIFGANASGKSNVYEAFRFMRQYVLLSFGYGGEETDPQGETEVIRATPFLFDAESKNAGSTFEVYFTENKGTPERTFNYGFSLGQDGVTEEWLNYKAKSTRHDFTRIFYRCASEKDCDYSGIPEASRENLQIALEKEALVVSLGAKLKIAKLKNIREWFANLSFSDFGNPFEIASRARRLPAGFTVDERVRKNVIAYFSSFDTSIIDFNVEELNSEKNKKRYKIFAVHRVAGSDDTVMIPLEQESAGTLKMFALYPALQNVLSVGGLLFVDELNARLHPLLVRTFVIAFLDPETNPNHAQLVFTSHDSWQLSSNILRRDEVWFTEKSESGVSSLYSLADFVDEDGVKIRKDENYEKNYLLGKYGAIPSMKSFDLFGRD